MARRLRLCDECGLPLEPDESGEFCRCDEIDGDELLDEFAGAYLDDDEGYDR